MNAITIKQPWASAIMAGVKRVENRVWSTRLRGTIAIHAGQSIDPAAAGILLAAGIDPEQFADAPRGAILGTVELVDVVRLDEPQLPGCEHDLADNPLATGPVCWVLENPRPLPEPVPCRGQQRFFRVEIG